MWIKVIDEIKLIDEISKKRLANGYAQTVLSALVIFWLIFQMKGT